MANNKIQVKRTSVSGRQPNTTGSYATNSQYIAAGELAYNLADGILYTSNGSAVVEIGANLTSAHITNSLTFDNDRQLRFKTVNSASYAYFVQQSDDNFVFYTTNGSYTPRPVFSIYANSGTSSFSIGVPVIFTGANVNLGTTGLSANGSLGGSGQVLTSNGTATYWSTVTSGAGSVNTDAQYTWTNIHTFSANVSFSDDIALNTNNAIYFGGLADANWRMARNSNTLTKWIYTNNTIDIVTANSPYEGFAIGLVSNATYFETGYLGTYVKDKLVVGNTSSNVTINSTAFTGTANNTLYVGSVTADNVVSNAQLSGNLANYVTSTNLTNNLANYQTTAGLNANIAAYLPTYTGTVNATTISTGSINVVNASGLTTTANVSIGAAGDLILTAGAGIYANGSLGSANQVLYSNGSSVYWANGGGGGGATLVANTTDTTTYYIPMANTTSGSWSNGVVANTKLYFVPSTGTLSATIFNSLSDADYKINVKTVKNSLDIVSQLRGVTFNWKEDGRASIGVIAQEVEKVLPELVTDHNQKKSVNYDGLIGVLIESIKELKEEIRILKQEKTK